MAPSFFQVDVDRLRVVEWLVNQGEVVPNDWVAALKNFGWVRENAKVPSGIELTEYGLKVANQP